MPYHKRKRARDEDGHRIEHPPPRSSWPLEAVVAVLLLAAPLAIGTVHLWTVLGMLLLAALAFGLLLWRTRRHGNGLKLFPLGLVLLVAAAWTALQLVPLPPGVVAALSPGAGDALETARAGTPLAGDWQPLSQSAPSTGLELLKLLGGLLVFLVVVNYHTDRHRARRLLKIVAWSGFAVALVGFFTKLFMARAIWGFYPMPREGFFFSTFVNPNHLAGFLLLCAPVALGLAFSAQGRQDRALYGFMGVIMGVAVFMSLSRGGMVAFAAGIGFLTFFAATRRARRLQRTFMVQALAAAVLLVAGYLAYDAVLKELRTLGDVAAVREEVKIQSWSALGPMIADHPLAGIGRGAYPIVYPRYKTLSHDATFTHAENETLQFLVDWGLPVGVLVIAGLVGCFLVGLSRARRSYTMGGILAGVFACLLHNQVDFNLETGAVLLVLLALYGVMATTPFSHAGRPPQWTSRLRLPRPAGWALLGLVLAAAAGLPAWVAAHDLDATTERLLAAKDQPRPAEPCDDSPLGAAACEAIAYHPADYLPPLVLGRAHLRAGQPALDRAVRWLAAAMLFNPTHAEAHRLAGRALFLAGQREQALLEYRLAARNAPQRRTAIVTEVLRLAGEPGAAIRATPRDAEALLDTARILNTLGRKAAAADAARLALEHNAGLLDAIDLLARLALERGRLVEAAELARRAVEIDPQHDAAWVMRGQVLLRQGRPEEAEEVWQEGWRTVPDSTRIAYRLVSLYLSQRRYQEAESAASRIETFAPPNDRAQARLLFLGGRIKEARQLFFDARQLYRRAVDLQPGNLAYLYRLGRLEEKVGAYDAAERIYEKLLEQRFRREEMRERIEVVRQARDLERDRAMWDKYVEPAAP
jgi:tetratricopeptide (TPR) repeat protein/O-antigen ligase